MGILEKISEIEKEIARTQKNKATEYHLGLLKAKLAKYRAQLLEPSKSSSKGEGFDVMKSGDARVALIGFPSVGKGRGRQVIAVARTADVVVMMLDATKGEVQRSLLEKELESVGIRLNKHKPNIYFRPKKGGGISFNSTVTLTQCSEKLVQLILHEYKIFNAEVLFREDCSPDEFIDVIVGNRVYMPCLYVYNKIDQISMEEVDRLARKPDSVVISCGMRLNLDYLLEMLWEYLALTCIYTKKRGQRPDFTDAIILRKGASVEHVVLQRLQPHSPLGAWRWDVGAPELTAHSPPVPPHPPLARQPVQVRASVGHQHQVQPTAGGPDARPGARGRHPDREEVAPAPAPSGTRRSPGVGSHLCRF
ncbi:developmentally-regulated GTP-binding protein 2 isoform X5 [Hippopotamus amphibius kiboko]|uniref:developmentally-regulated GTP-binding protein 2 isoform X5 n=1 Tax=Hippopotamus amphibius kiboko TaxID=575201 RepID=UPI002599AEB1|nr:developmentally-regulated GTP-binding protein 2 isoform X5 [Hippopotamus amphibius kiboko]